MNATGSSAMIAEIQVLKQEIDRLKARVFELEAIIDFGSSKTLEQYRSLCARAADALEEDHEVIKDFFSNSKVRDKHLPLVQELREAAK